MTTKTKIAALARRKAVLESKLKAVRESKKSGLAYLIESELEKAEVLLVAKSVVEKLQKMAEDLAKIEGSDIMPALEGLKAAYGPQLAEQFQQVAGESLRGLVQSVVQAKDAIGASVAKFEGVLNGDGPGNDMADMDDDADMGGDMGADMGGDMGGEAEPAMGAPAPTDDMGGDALGGVEAGVDGDDFADMDDSAFDTGAAGSTAAGRPKKESAAPRGRMVREGEFVKGQKGVNPFAKKDDAKKDDKKDAKKDCKDDKDCEKVEESISDARILKAFRTKVREGKKPVPAAKAVAESFGVDLEDVVAIVRENRR